MLRDEHPGSAIYLRLDKIVVGYAILAFAPAAILQAPYYVSAMIRFVIETGDVRSTSDSGKIAAA